MNFVEKLKLKSWNLKEYYLFQRAGIPPKKFDKISKSVMKKYLPANPVMIDCGAHNGADSVELIRILGGEVHAFEPVKDLFLQLKERVKRYPGIHCYNLALGNQTGTQVFYISEGGSDASSSLLEPQDHLVDHPDVVFNKKEVVETSTLDDWAAKYNIRKVDLLWLDMQGFELKMLEASEKILQTVKVIHSEVSLTHAYKGGPLYPEYKKFLEERGFSVEMEALPQGWDMGNALFVRR